MRGTSQKYPDVAMNDYRDTPPKGRITLEPQTDLEIQGPRLRSTLSRQSIEKLNGLITGSAKNSGNLAI